MHLVVVNSCYKSICYFVFLTAFAVGDGDAEGEGLAIGLGLTAAGADDVAGDGVVVTGAFVLVPESQAAANAMTNTVESKDTMRRVILIFESCISFASLEQN
jgi:hypothetical protein